MQRKIMTETTNILHDKANLPEGYKNSPLGAIPKEWEVKKLGDISTQLGNFSFSRAQLTDKTQRLRYIHYGDIHVMSERDNVDLRKDDLPFLLDGLIDNTKIENQNFPLLQDGDVIFVDASEDYEGIGNCWEVLNTNGYEIISGLHTIAIRFDKKFVSVGFGRHVFKNRKSSTALRVIAHGTKVYSLSYKNMTKLKIAIPPLPEQQKIAEILSTWDATIEKQNALIEQLELRKRGLMQQLLTGKLRLRNDEGERFNEEWKKARLGEFFKETTEFVGDRVIEPIAVGVHGIRLRTKDDNISGKYEFLQKSFDPKYAPPAIVYDMLNADKVVIFGHSLGTNDSQYFKAFFKQQSSADRPIKKDITIFTKDDNSEIEIKRALKLMTDNELSSLFSLNNLEFIKTDNIYLNPESFRPFLRKHLIDERQVNVQIRQLKDRLTE
jgi:hypothetical protein